MTRSRVLAVASPKGSPGCSFIALGLAGRLAEAGLETLLVDADGESGSIAAALDLRPAAERVPISGLGLVTEAAIAGAAVTVGRLHCLDLSGPDAGVDGRQLVEAARARHPVVIADLGHHPGRLQRELVACADWLIWVVAPDRLGFERADAVLSGESLPRVSAGIVLNRLGPDRLADAGLALAERHRLPVLVRLPESSGGARAAGRKSAGPHGQREFRRHFAELARCLHPDAGGGGGGRWP